MRRLAENTKLQSQVTNPLRTSFQTAHVTLFFICLISCSQVQYHADFEKAKGKFTQVADDPETLRIKANTKIIRFVFTPVLEQHTVN